MNRARAKNRMIISLVFALVFGALALVSHLQIEEARQQGKMNVTNRTSTGSPVTVISAQSQPREFADNMQSKEIFRVAYLLGLLLAFGFAVRFGYRLWRNPRT